MKAFSGEINRRLSQNVFIEHWPWKSYHHCSSMEDIASHKKQDMQRVEWLDCGPKRERHWKKPYQKLQPCIFCKRGCCGQPCNPFSERLPTAQISTQGIAFRGAPVNIMLEQRANLKRLSKIPPVTSREWRESTSILHQSDPLRYLRQESRIWANSWTRQLHRSQRGCKSN